MKKIVINACYGGFSLSPEATLKLWERGVTEIGKPVEEYFGALYSLRAGRDGQSHFTFTYQLDQWRRYLEGDKERAYFLTIFSPDEKYALSNRNIRRDHPELVRVVEEMGEAANGVSAELKVVEIPDGVEWEIDEYDGVETIHETHRSWR